MKLDDKVLEELHRVETEILVEVDKFCRKYDIPYSLYCGTLLGAVRHKGFIPWDDDVDICMLRRDYERFIRLWSEQKTEKYILQCKENDPKTSNSFVKIRKDHTTFMQTGIDENADYHTGIFIDIFPLDRYPAKRIQQIRFNWNLMRLLLYTREFAPPKANPVVKAISKLMLMGTSTEKRKQMRERLYAQITQYNADKSLKLVSANTLNGIRYPLPAELPESYTELEFETYTFRCYSDYDQMLSTWYGDYMKLPPESEQNWTHKPFAIDFHHNYGETE